MGQDESHGRRRSTGYPATLAPLQLIGSTRSCWRSSPRHSVARDMVLGTERRPPVVYAGQSVKRFEDPKLLTGQGAFLDDVKLPGMLHAVVLRSPHAHAHITAIDTTVARHLPGVVS